MAGRDRDEASLTALDPETVADVVESGPLGATLTELDAVFAAADHDVTLTLYGSTYMRWKQIDLSDDDPGSSIAFRVDTDAEELQQTVPGFPPDLDGFHTIDVEDMVAPDLHISFRYNEAYSETVPIDARYEAISIHLPTEDAVQDELEEKSLFD